MRAVKGGLGGIRHVCNVLVVPVLGLSGFPGQLFCSCHLKVGRELGWMNGPAGPEAENSLGVGMDTHVS